MIPRRLLATLVFGLPVLVVSFAVIASAALLAQGLGDVAGARGLFWAAMGALLAIVVDMLLLVGVLGLMALDHTPDQSHDRDEGS
jgi:hypothetical protein